MTEKLTRLTHKITIQLQLMAESCTICSSQQSALARLENVMQRLCIECYAVATSGPCVLDHIKLIHVSTYSILKCGGSRNSCFVRKNLGLLDVLFTPNIYLICRQSTGQFRKAIIPLTCNINVY
jgi:hypothetical protein